jgi:hypothetical protein
MSVEGDYINQGCTNLKEFRLLSERNVGVMATESELYGFNIGQTNVKVDNGSILTDGSYKSASSV